ncbi:MAG TPA: hypothetical protein VGC03_05040 [Acidimicrobiia bacterium]
MSETNVETTLDAAKDALGFLVASLEGAGFGDNASAYVKMAEVVVSQRLWVDDEGIDRFDDDFLAVGTLGVRIHELLDPYIRMAMSLTVLLKLTPDISHFDPDSPEALVLQWLGGEAMSATAIASVTGLRTSLVRSALAQLVESNLVAERRSGSRTRFVRVLQADG